MELHELTDGKRVRTPAEESLSINGMLARWLADNSGTLDATGSSNAFAVTTSQGFTEYFDGMTLTFTANHTISGAATLNVNEIGAESLKKDAAGDTENGDIVIGQRVAVSYDGTNFQIVGRIKQEAAVDQRLVGEVIDYSGSTAPAGWLFCSGQAVSRTTYADLFAIISTTYGVGDGSTTFNVPDLRGRVVAGLGGTTAGRLTGAGSGIDGDTLGDTGGAETHTLTEDEMPSHDGHITGAVGTSGSSAGASSSSAGEIRGADQPHNNVQPTLILNKIIYTGVAA